MKNPRKATVRIAYAAQMRQTVSATIRNNYQNAQPISIPKSTPKNRNSEMEEELIPKVEEMNFRAFLKRHLPRQSASPELAERVINAIRCKK